MYHRRRECAAEARVFAETLGDASPARVASDIDHRREGPADAFRGRLARRVPGGLLDKFRVPSRCLGQWNRENCFISVDDVASEQQRNAQPALPHRDALRFGAVRGTAGVKE